MTQNLTYKVQELVKTHLQHSLYISPQNPLSPSQVPSPTKNNALDPILPKILHFDQDFLQFWTQESPDKKSLNDGLSFFVVKGSGISPVKQVQHIIKEKEISSNEIVRTLKYHNKLINTVKSDLSTQNVLLFEVAAKTE